MAEKLMGGAVRKSKDSSANPKDGTSTKTETKTSTSTDAYTAGNITVTGGAGAGDTTVTITPSKDHGYSPASGDPPDKKSKLMGGAVRR